MDNETYDLQKKIIENIKSQLCCKDRILQDMEHKIKGLIGYKISFYCATIAFIGAVVAFILVI